MMASLDELFTQVTERRKDLLTRTARGRTRQFCMVLEDLFDPHNISAVIRTAEVFGLQDVHVIEEDNPYRVNKSILKGSFKWMSLFLYKKRMTCVSQLKAKGYKIAVASTNTENSVFDLDLEQPTAFYLGSEFHGNHPDTLAAADYEFKLPQYGITESMNVSVAAGVLMTYLDVFMKKKGREYYALSKEDQNILLADWLDRHIHGTDNNSPLCRIDD